MKQRVVYLLLLIILIILAFVIGANVGIAEGQDGYYYMTIGELVFKHNFIPIGPFNLHTPRLIYPPLFGGLGILILNNIPPPYTMIVWILFQFVLLGISAICIATTARDIIGGKYEMVGLLVFLALPFQFLYATTLWAETVSIFLLSVYLRFLLSVFMKKKNIWPSTLVLFSSLMTLVKVNFLYLFLFSLVVWFVTIFTRYSHASFRKLVLLTIPTVLGICGILGWMLIIYQYVGKFEISTNQGGTIFFAAVQQAKLLPPETDPTSIELMKWVSKDSLLREPVWTFIDQFIPPFMNGKITEDQINTILGNFGKAAILHHRWEYISFVLRNTVSLGIYSPMVWDMYKDLGVPTDGRVKYCRTDWNRNLCRPMYDNPVILDAWIRFIHWQESLYPYPALIIYIIAYIGIITAALKRNILQIIVVMLFFMLLFEHAMVAGSMYGRYFMILYPMYALLVTLGIQTIIKGITFGVSKIKSGKT